MCVFIGDLVNSSLRCRTSTECTQNLLLEIPEPVGSKEGSPFFELESGLLRDGSPNVGDDRGVGRV